MLTMDPKYIEYRNFGLFYLKVVTDYDTKKESLVLESDIVKTTMHVDHHAESSAPIKTVKKFYKKLELYFDEKDEPAIVMDLTPLRLENSISMSAKIVTDGYVVDSLEIKLSQANFQKFRKLKPERAQVILYDAEGKIVTTAEASIDRE